MNSEKLPFLSILTEMPLDSVSHDYCKTTIVHENAADEESGEEIDWLADYPKVHYVYKVSEIAFLLYKLNQQVRYSRDAKRWKLRQAFEKREVLLNRISENVDKALRRFQQSKRMKGEVQRINKKKRICGVFEVNVKNVDSSTETKQLIDFRKQLLKQFDKVCSEEMENIKKLLAACVQESLILWESLHIN